MNFILYLLVVLFEGLVLQYGWNWHLATFTGKTLPYSTAVAMMILVGWMTYHLPSKRYELMQEDVKDETPFGRFARNAITIIIAAMMWGIFWVWHLVTP